MPKKKAKGSKKAPRRTSRKRGVSYGVIAGILLVSLFIIYIGFNNIKRNSISTFEECVNSGMQPANTSPRECTADGKTYYEALTNIPPQILQIKKGTNDIPLDIERGNYVINSKSEWDMLFSGTSIRPDVDFDDKTIIAVVMGQRPSGGYSVSLKQVEVGGDHIEFMVNEIIPGEGCINTGVLTNPYQIIAIEKTDKEIQFVGNTIESDC